MNAQAQQRATHAESRGELGGAAVCRARGREPAACGRNRGALVNPRGCGCGCTAPSDGYGRDRTVSDWSRRLRAPVAQSLGRGPWAVGRAVVLVQFCVIQLELIEPARCWGDYIIRYSICVAKKNI